jgi:hypothetical protein
VSATIRKLRYPVTTNCSSFATNAKNRSIRKEWERFFAHPKWAKRFLRTQKNFFANKTAMKAQQKQPKTEERRAFENVSACSILLQMFCQSKTDFFFLSSNHEVLAHSHPQP